MAGQLESLTESRVAEGTGLSFKEVRCARCRRLLFRWDMSGPSQVEVKCPRCQQINLVKLEHRRIC
jgi:phage FluMu protein Com